MPLRPPRPRTPLVTIAASLAALPLLWSVALAAEPTIVVEQGDTLSEIALEQGVTVEQLVTLNGLPDPDLILAGQRLRLAPSSAPATTAPPAAVGAGTHVVARGENLTRIARGYGISVAAIVAANGISNPSLIFPGQQLAIPSVDSAVSSATAELPAAPAAPAPPSLPATMHVVARDENLTRIARGYGTTVAAIVAANGITNPSLIFPGQQLVIPGVEPAAPAPAQAGASSLPEATALLMAQRDEVRALIVEHAQRFGVPPSFALAVAWQESGWRQDAVSSAGAIGVMQLLPATADWVGQAMLGYPVSVEDAGSNVEAGVRLLAHYLARYGGNRELALAAYFQGQSAADRHGVYPMSRPYVNAVLSLEARLGGG